MGEKKEKKLLFPIRELHHLFPTAVVGGFHWDSWVTPGYLQLGFKSRPPSSNRVEPVNGVLQLFDKLMIFCYWIHYKSFSRKILKPETRSQRTFKLGVFIPDPVLNQSNLEYQIGNKQVFLQKYYAGSLTKNSIFRLTLYNLFKFGIQRP